MAEAQVGSVCSDLRLLLESADGADVTLVVGSSEFPAHSQILSARSQVFAAMLRNDMKEARSRRIEITNMREEVLRQMLSFIYTDTAPELGNVAAELLAVADKYELPLLKERCEQRLARDLTVENAAAAAALAIVHRCPGLRDAAVQFMAAHLEVMGSAAWAQVLRENAEAAVEISKQLALASLPANRVPTEEHRQNLSERLVRAAWNGEIDEVRALLQLGAPADAKDANGDSALHNAVWSRMHDVVSCLISAGADVNIRDLNGRTPLHGADEHTIWVLVSASADKNVQDNDGQAPLHLAAKSGCRQSTKVMLQIGARRDIRDNNGKTPADVATSATRPLFNNY